MHVEGILREAVRRQAADVIISAGAPVMYHVLGRLEQGDPARPLTAQESESLTYQLLKDEQRRLFETEKELDFSFAFRDIARFRVSVYRQRGSVASVLRLVPLKVPHYAEIGISNRLLMQMLAIPNGLILVTGPTGAGKSTTVASMIEYLNTENNVPKHIITIEEPIEFYLESKVCVIDQREVGTDTHSYVAGLRSALRQMPHIIFVGEMRDRATMEVALTAAETGSIVVSTLATQSAAKTINRIIDGFPLEDEAEVRARLALSLKVVISQVLVRRKGEESRMAAREILFVNASIANLIREGKVHQINNAISGGASEGMVLLDDALIGLHEAGAVSAADLLPRMQDPEKARRLLQSARERS